MSNLQRVSRFAGFLRGVTIAAMIVLPVTVTGGLLTMELVPEALGGDTTASLDATRWQLITVMGLNLASPIILLLTLNEMRKLFGAYTTGEVLTDRCARLIQRVGQGFLALAIVPFLLRPVQTFLLTMSNPPGQRSISVGLDSEMIFFALSGGLIIVIGWAMGEASRVASENRSFV